MKHCYEYAKSKREHAVMKTVQKHCPKKLEKGTNDETSLKLDLKYKNRIRKP